MKASTSPSSSSHSVPPPVQLAPVSRTSKVCHKRTWLRTGWNRGLLVHRVIEVNQCAAASPCTVLAKSSFTLRGTYYSNVQCKTMELCQFLNFQNPIPSPHSLLITQHYHGSPLSITRTLHHSFPSRHHKLLITVTFVL